MANDVDVEPRRGISAQKLLQRRQARVVSTRWLGRQGRQARGKLQLQLSPGGRRDVIQTAKGRQRVRQGRKTPERRKRRKRRKDSSNSAAWQRAAEMQNDIAPFDYCS